MIEGGRKIDIADLEQLAARANAKAVLGNARPFQFPGRVHEITHATETPTVAGWLNNTHLQGLLAGDIVVNVTHGNRTGSRGVWKLLRYPWNNPANWVRFAMFVGTYDQQFTVTLPVFGRLYWMTDQPRRRDRLWVYRSPGRFEQYLGWATELGRLLEALRLQQNLLDPARTNQFSGYRMRALVSERHVEGASTELTGRLDDRSAMLEGDYDLTPNDLRADLPAEIPSGHGIQLGAGLRAKELEVLHEVNGLDRSWDAVVVPWMKIEGTEWIFEGFRLVSSVPMEIKGRLSPYGDGIGRPDFAAGDPRNWTFTLNGLSAGQPTVRLSGNLSPYARVSVLDNPSVNEGPGIVVYRLHISLEGVLPASPEGMDYSLGFEIQLPSGATYNTPPGSRLKLLRAGSAPLYPVFLRARDIATSTNATRDRKVMKVTEGDMWTSGVLPTMYCEALPGNPDFVRAGEPAGVVGFYPGAGVVAEGFSYRTIAKTFPLGLWRYEFTPETGAGGQVFALGYSDPGGSPNLETPVIHKVNPRGPDGGFTLNGSSILDGNQLSHTGKVWPCYKSTSVEANAALYRPFKDLAGVDVPDGIVFGEIHEIIVARNSIERSNGMREMPTPEEALAPLTVRVGYYKAGAIGRLITLKTIEIPAGSNVGRWTAAGAPIAAYDPWPLVYECEEHVLVSVSYREPVEGGEAFAVTVPLMAETAANAQRLIDAL